jgi:ComF family protein
MAMQATLARLGRTALDLLYPPRCVLCGAGGSFLCTRCLDGLPRATGPRCDACWLPAAGFCYRCAERPLALERLRSIFCYEGPVRRLVHAFKFGGQTCLAEPMAVELLPLLEQADPATDLLVPVAMPRMRERQRGFNQSQLLARHLGKVAGLPVVDALSRQRDNGTQVSSLNAAERWRRVHGAFSVRDDAAIAGRRLVLIDDIATTGATLDACARALLGAGAASVSAVTLARED